MRLILAGVLLGAVSLSMAASGQDVGWPPGPVPKSGQTYSYVVGDDGETQLGVAWPNPRFTANVDHNGDGDCTDGGESCNGTVTDNLTGLLWLRNAGCTAFFAGDSAGTNERSLSETDLAVAYLGQGYCGLADGSSPGDWRIPNIRELDSLVSFGWAGPSLSDTTGTTQHTNGNPFLSVHNDPYWTFTYNSGAATQMWQLDFGTGQRGSYAGTAHIWPVRVTPAPVFADGFGPGSSQQWSGEVP